MIKSLTSLRFVFALMVFMSHCILVDKDQHPFIYHLFYEGYVGVSFFFILSGFILAYAYQDRFAKERITKYSFYVARFARIYPLHILTMLIWVYMRKDHPLDEPYIVNFISNIFLVQSFYPTDEIRFNEAAWSLSDEMFFYLLFPFLILYYTTSKRKLSTLLIGASLLIFILSYVFRGIKNEEWFFYSFPPVRLFDFMLGFFLYNLSNSAKFNALVKRFNPNLLEVFSIVVFIIFYVLAYFVPEVYRYALWYWLPVGFLILAFYFQQGYISKLLSTNRLVWLGEISFSFYLFSPIVKWYIGRAFSIVNIQAPKLIIFVSAIILSIIVSAYSFKYLEIPVNRWIKRKLDK